MMIGGTRPSFTCRASAFTVRHSGLVQAAESLSCPRQARPRQCREEMARNLHGAEARRRGGEEARRRGGEEN
eukprot:748125-Hanusia_phi.AAC.1